jgi:hypothetical protein
MSATSPQSESLSLRGKGLTRLQQRQLSVAALGLDERTIRRAYANPASVRESTLARVVQAAKALGFPEPAFPGAP